IPQDLPDRPGVDIARDRLHLDRGVHASKAPRGSLRLRRVDVGLGIQGLSLEVHQFDHIAIDEAHATDTGSDEQVGGDAPERAPATSSRTSSPRLARTMSPAIACMSSSVAPIRVISAVPIRPTASTMRLFASSRSAKSAGPRLHFSFKASTSTWIWCDAE